MSAWLNRNAVKALKETKASPTMAAVPGDDEKSDAPRRLVSVEPKKAPATVSAVTAAVAATTPEPVSTERPDAAPEVLYTSLGPVSMPQVLAKLVIPSEFRFAGVVENPESPVTLQPAATRQPADAVPTQVAASKPVVIAPPIPVAATPASTVTSSSDLQHPQQKQQYHPQSPPQSAYIPQVNNMPQFEGAWPHGGELGSVPRYYSSQPQYNAQPFYPSYQTAHFPGGYTSNTPQYGGFRPTYQGYYSVPGVPYMGCRLQPCAPYYPPPEPPQQHHHTAAQYN